MSCHELEGLWVPYLDEKLPPRQRERLEAHMAGCAGCAARIREFRAVSELLGQWEAPAPSAWFDVRLRGRIAAEPARGAWWDWLPAFSPGFPLGVAALLFLAALVVWTGGGQSALPPAQVVTVEKTDIALYVVEDVNLLSDFDLLSELNKPGNREALEKGRE
jgi:anti-sigma factor RsiW